MSFTNNASNLTGKSTTNAFNVIAESLTVNKNTLCKGDLTVLGTTNIGNVSLENGFVNNLTVNNFTATNPVPITSGGTGLATIGAPNQVLTVNSGGTGLIYQAPGLINPVTVTGTGFTGNPTLSFGLEADTGSLGRGFIRTGIAAVSGLCLGTSSATVLRLWSNFSTDSNAEITNTNANFTYNSTGSSGVFQVLNAGGGISFTNSGIGTISMATAAGTISMATGAGSISLTTGVGATNITTGAGPINLTTGAGNIELTTAAAGIISLAVATAGGINIGTSLGFVNLYGSALTLAAPVIYIGTAISPPIPSILTFACGAINGFTGAWDLTTLAFQLNALSIQLNSIGTIALSNNTTVTGTFSSTNSINCNSSGLAAVSTLNPSLYVYNVGGSQFGMDLGYSATSSRFRTRIFCPGSDDIVLSSCTISPTLQSNFTDRIIVNGTTGAISLLNNTTVTNTLTVNNGNIFTNQNIIGGVEIINNGDINLTSASPGNILIRGGSGSIITLPNATTLIVGYIYTINNNSNHPTIVNPFTSGTVGTVPALNAATVTCINTSSANGQWDIHITGPSTGTDWATPGQIGSAIPNTGAFTTLSAVSSLTANSANAASTTLINPPVFVYNIGGSQYGMDLGYNATSSRYRTRIFCPTSDDIVLSSCTLSPTLQSNFTDRLIVRGDTGNIEVIQNLQVNSNNLLSTTTLTPGVTVYNAGPGNKYGMDCGYSSISTRYRTRISCPESGDISLSTQSLGSGVNQSDYSDRLIVRGDTGNVQIVCPDMSISGISTNIIGALNVTGTSTSLGDAGCLKVNNSSTAVATTLASFLQPTLGDIGVLTEDLNLTFGKSNTTNNSTQLQFGYTLASPTYSNPFTTWGFYGLSGTSIQLRQNPSATQDQVLIKGNTRIDGDLKINGAVAVKNSSSIYFNTAAFTVLSDVWSDVKNMLVSRSSGLNVLSLVSGEFRNNTGYTLQVSVSFSCQQATAGFTSLRIAYTDSTGIIAQQDIESTNPQYGNVSGNINLIPGERIRCLIRPVLGIFGIPVTFQGIIITINTTPIF